MSEPAPLPEIHCGYTTMETPSSLTPHPKNPNHHQDGQIKLLAKIIQAQGWRSPIVVSQSTGLIVAGHGRWMAATLAGWELIPVEIQKFSDPASELAHMIADNRLSELSDVNLEEVKELFESEEFEGFDMELTGYDEQFLFGEEEIPKDGETSEVDVDGFELDCTCPKCGFQFNQKK